MERHDAQLRSPRRGLNQILTRGARHLAQLAVGAVFTVLTVVGSSARAEVHIDITHGNVQPMPIAITNFFADTSSEGQVGRDIAGVISADLERSGLFKPVDPHAFIQDAASLQAGTPRFADWRVINAQALVTGAVRPKGDGQLSVEFRLWDVFAEQQMTGLAYATIPNNWRRVAHIIADAIYKRVTGEDGYFDTRIVYISESGPMLARKKRLAIMDQDGENHRFLTDGNDLVLTPRFSPTSQEITYMSYFRNTPRVYIFNIDTGRQELLGDFPGMTFAPRFSPDGNRVIMSLAQNGRTNIYVMDLRTRHTTQLTNTNAIDTAPCYSPDGSQIVFESDRGGSPQLYIMDAGGGNVHRISYGAGRYDGPVWSPRGDLIAFTRENGGRFSIGVIRPDGTGERTLDEAFHTEGATWAPNGRVLMFFRETASADGRARSARLYTIDLTGTNPRRVPTPLDASDPAWSPLIP
ncbi:MAG: Tol-Pal system beta propeller repeat protein TolB [Azospirillaceae bacterium]|nr:Tol-Pal system beta propeller repeat protein TolB [Azospirillaceae bacterium]